jgi:hypothetical protein
VRNLGQYPITLQEKLELIDAATEAERQRVGDAIGGVTLEAWRQIRMDVTAHAVRESRPERTEVGA